MPLDVSIITFQVRRLTRPEFASHPELWGPGVQPHPDLPLPRDMAVFRPDVDDPRHDRSMVFRKRVYPDHRNSKVRARFRCFMFGDFLELIFLTLCLEIA
jgi:hypothetical protein